MRLHTLLTLVMMGRIAEAQRQAGGCTMPIAENIANLAQAMGLDIDANKVNEVIQCEWAMPEWVFGDEQETLLHPGILVKAG